MPPLVTISSPDVRAASIFSCAFCFLRWGAIIRKYIAANSRPKNMSCGNAAPAEGAACWAKKAVASFVRDIFIIAC